MDWHGKMTIQGKNALYKQFLWTRKNEQYLQENIV